MKDQTIKHKRSTSDPSLKEQLSKNPQDKRSISEKALSPGRTQQQISSESSITDDSSSNGGDTISPLRSTISTDFYYRQQQTTTTLVDPQELEERRKFERLRETLRPAALSIPIGREAPSPRIYGYGGTATSGTASMYIEIGGQKYLRKDRLSSLSNEIEDSKLTPNLKVGLGHPGSSSTDSYEEGASLVYTSTLHVPHDLVIPENRIKTPRTPQIPPSSVNRRRTRSPSDERAIGLVHTSPSAYMINRYKSQTPRARDFKI